MVKEYTKQETNRSRRQAEPIFLKNWIVSEQHSVTTWKTALSKRNSAIHISDMQITAGHYTDNLILQISLNLS
jgi:hypothetical protein